MTPLDGERIRALLGDDTLPVHVLECVDSTSTDCRRRLAAGEERCLVLAERQSAGRGRQGKQFYSPAGRGLYLSLLFAPEGGLRSADAFTAWAAVCTARAVETVTGRACGIKWVNDLYFRGRKVCGILTEAVGGHLIVGVGVDLRAGDLPPELRETVGALETDADRNALAAGIVRGLLDYAPEERGFYAEYRRRSVVLGREIRFLENGTEKRGRALDILDDGALLVETAEGRAALRSGEVTLLRTEQAVKQ